LTSERTIQVAKQKVLVVDDDENTCELIRMQLDMAGYDPVCARDGREALSAAREHRPSLMILDLVLPEMDGMEVFREVKRSTNVPIIMVTARSDEFDRVLGLEMGADDYVTKPFSLRELMARVKAVLRRSNATQSASEQQLLNLPGLYVNLLSREVRINDQRVELTPKEFDLLWHLARNRDRVFTREDLLKQVWDYEEFFGDERTVDQHVKRLRRKIQDEQAPCRITTIWGVGYKFELANGTR
jgi:two-component system response regulator ResD